MKKFFEDIKKDIKFKSAGPGKKLTEASSSKAEVVQSSCGSKHNRNAPSEGSQRAGAAALARIEQHPRPKVHTSQDAIRNQGEVQFSRGKGEANRRPIDGYSETPTRQGCKHGKTGVIMTLGMAKGVGQDGLETPAVGQRSRGCGWTRDRTGGSARLVKRELETAALADKERSNPEEESKVVEKDLSCLSVSGVYFTCPLTGATLTKSEREVHIKEAILMRFEEDAVEASVMMVHTFNKDREKVKAAVDIMSKYIENICKNPTEEKYRKIKLSNKVYQEKVRCVDGCREFLEALGFTSILLPVEGQEEEEEFLVLLEHGPDALELMKERRDRLQRGEPVRAQLDRQPQAFRSSPHGQRFELPPDFYNLTAEELKREQHQRSESVEKNAMMRTKAMREKEEQRERRKYNYTLLRIRLPDGSLLQGTFYAWDRLTTLFCFVRDSLVDGWRPFELLAPGGQKLTESEEVALAECNLVPAALLTFSWDAAVQADITAAGGSSSAILKPELLETLRTLS